MFADEDLIPISALQHHLFCPRQCALIHVDGLWAENRLTAEGRLLHDRSDTPGYRTRPMPTPKRNPPTAPIEQADAQGEPPVTDVRPSAVRTVRSLPLLSRVHGIVGKADQVEFPLDVDGQLMPSPRPIEHKRGKPKHLNHDRVQVAAQALCLEEAFGMPVSEGELFYHAVRRRETVVIDQPLRDLTMRVIAEVRRNIETNRVPPAVRKPKCKSCSLLHLCLPDGTGPDRNPAMYLKRSLAISLNDTGQTASEQER